ncbi:DUF3558 family protein [Saccharomonospora sp. NPDC046836]|uniref:DUF3558 family protein n=1 Tax=Saccharomonospora sp. NPDC046836 TaxID=3156921 RepID=UPI0033D49DD0
MRAGLPLVVASLFVSACTDSEDGTAEPQGGSDTPSVTSGPSATTSSPADGNGSSLADLDPCTLLDTSDVHRYGNHKEAEHRTVGTARACVWFPLRESGSEKIPTIATLIRENAGADDVNDIGQGVQRTQANGRDIAQAAGPGTCVIAIGVTATSRVDVQVTGIEADDACTVANELAVIVEPTVPRG